MIWSVFSLYVLDNYNEEDFAIVNENMSRLMNDERGFIHFRDFNNKLLELYKNDNRISISELYDSILKWCSSVTKEHINSL